MIRKLWLLFLVLAPPLHPGAADRLDNRLIRDIQSRAYGSPRLESGAGKEEAVLALAELGASASGGAGGQMQSADYDALFALLQRYRDEILKLGIDATELDAQIKNLEVRSAELQERLDKLKPKDGLKIGGRLYSAFDDMHLLGNAALSAPGRQAKAAGQGIRYQMGVVHAELKLAASRGPLSGYIQFDIVQPWGVSFLQNALNPRRIYLELRLPVSLQFGDIDSALTPLTLWRNDEYEPFEPEPFAAREKRMRDDMMLAPNRWRISGGRASTDINFFNAQLLKLESLTAIVGDPNSLSTPPNAYIYVTSGTPALNVMERYASYLEAWRASLPIAGVVTLAYQGTLFWDVPSTGPSVAYIRSFNSTVHSVGLDLRASIFKAGVEYAMSSYVLPSLTGTAQPNPMTGTALTYEAGIEAQGGHVKGFGRMVSSDFYSAGAQGRTVDAGYQYLGPLLPENSQVNSDGTVGINKLPPNYAGRINDKMIPPGTINSGLAASIVIANAWQHLLPYFPYESIDPYGAATPNRAGYGVDADWKFFKGLVRPRASYEVSQNIDAVSATLTAFTMARMRAGLHFDLKGLTDIGLRFGGGYTATTSLNGQVNAASGESYTLNTAQTEGGLEYDFTDSTGISAGYRRLEIKGLNEKFNFLKGYAWETIGGGIWWKPMEVLRFDALYTRQVNQIPGVLNTDFEIDQTVLRLTLEF